MGDVVFTALDTEAHSLEGEMRTSKGELKIGLASRGACAETILIGGS